MVILRDTSKIDDFADEVEKIDLFFANGFPGPGSDPSSIFLPAPSINDIIDRNENDEQ
jgi:hypothetical protein